LWRPATPAVAQTIQREFSSPTLRIYTNEDVAGVELGGALKNVIALAAGVVHGLDLGYNSGGGAHHARHRGDHAPGRGLRRAQADAGGLSGMGDLVLTCTGSLSRNRMVGIELGKGRKLARFWRG
jgi:glycerol-3-phosphate dehydrogenase (NAD(P)+)